MVLTTGERPAELEAALASARAQHEVELELILVLNVDGDPSPPEWRDDVLVLSPGRNLGIPAGRNLGVRYARGELVLFLDDDGVLASPEILCAAEQRFAADDTLAVVTMRIVDPATGLTQRRHVPRVRVGDPERGSWVTSFLGGASVVRRSAFEEVGGFPDGFFYAHEETSVGWRLIDHGYRIRYAPSLVLHHPGAPPARHADYHELSGRNRVLLARMHLPWLVAVVHVLLWLVVSALRQPAGCGAMLRGASAGARAPVHRRPISWRTVWRLTRYGRPPLI